MPPASRLLPACLLTASLIVPGGWLTDDEPGSGRFRSSSAAGCAALVTWSPRSTCRIRSVSTTAGTPIPAFALRCRSAARHLPSCRTKWNARQYLPRPRRARFRRAVRLSYRLTHSTAADLERYIWDPLSPASPPHAAIQRDTAPVFSACELSTSSSRLLAPDPTSPMRPASSVPPDAGRRPGCHRSAGRLSNPQQSARSRCGAASAQRVRRGRTPSLRPDTARTHGSKSKHDAPEMMLQSRPRR
jgi:hypothetical protein